MASTYEVSGEEALYRSYDIDNKYLHVYPRANINVITDSITGNTSTAAYGTGDVVASASTTGTGLAWEFDEAGRINGASGRVVQARVVCSTTGLTDSVSLHLFSATPTSMLDDNVASTAPLAADIDNYIGRIDFPALIDYGTGMSESMAVQGSTLFTLPMYYTCATDDDELYGILITRSAIDSVAAAATWYVTLWVERF